MRSESGTWWRQAEADLATAETLLRADRAYAVSWFAQQAVEKGLKSLYVDRRGQMAPRTHDLEYLGELLNAPREVAEALTLVNPAFDLSRYPDPTNEQAPVDQITLEMAERHYEAAERIMRWLKEQLLSSRP